jgi:Polyhydroxyalkanoic acid inclusion protein (PhaP_Bmeg)
MAQKKSENVQAVEEKMIPVAEEPNKEGLFVDTLWNQYEQSLERARRLRENREDAYVSALKEVIKFNKQYRNSLANLFEQTKKTNKDVVSGFMQQMNARREQLMKDEERIEAEMMNEKEELKEQLKEVSHQLENLALTPIKSFFHIIDQLEDNFEKSTEANIVYGRERRNAWQQVTNEYVKMARNTHNEIINRGKNSVKELLKAR